MSKVSDRVRRSGAVVTLVPIKFVGMTMDPHFDLWVLLKEVCPPVHVLLPPIRFSTSCRGRVLNRLMTKDYRCRRWILMSHITDPFIFNRMRPGDVSQLRDNKEKDAAAHHRIDRVVHGQLIDE